MTDSKDNLLERDEKGIPLKEPRPEYGSSTPEENVPIEGEEETTYNNPNDKLAPEEMEEVDPDARDRPSPKPYE